MPFLFGVARKPLWQIFLQRLWKKFAGWKGATLSLAGKRLLVKLVLQSILVDCASVFKLPANLCKEIDQICCKFIWSGTKEKQIMSLVCWKKICLPKKFGGLGLRRIKWFCEALRSKVGWKLSMEENKEWIKICKAKYMD